MFVLDLLALLGCLLDLAYQLLSLQVGFFLKLLLCFVCLLEFFVFLLKLDVQVFFRLLIGVWIRVVILVSELFFQVRDLCFKILDLLSKLSILILRFHDFFFVILNFFIKTCNAASSLLFRQLCLSALLDHHLHLVLELLLVRLSLGCCLIKCL